MKNRKLILLVFLIWGFQLTYAVNLKLPSIIGSHMVLQQKSSVAIWGWAKAGTVVTIKPGWMANASQATVNSDGTWKIKLITPEAGGPFEISIKSDTTIILKDILIGEVWVCSGQSNMEMPVAGNPSQPVNGSIDYIAHGNNKNIRLFTVKQAISAKPLNNCGGEWNVSSSSNVANFSAVAYFFGQYLQETLGIPVGLISTSWGGTPVQSWTDDITMTNEFKEFDLSALNTEQIFEPSTPTVLFNSMIHPLLNFTIRGAIWYQGEANISNPDQYTKLFPAMIRGWRKLWNQGEFPFYYVQIAPFKYSPEINSSFLRESQLKTMQTIPNTGMAVTMDIGEYECIHPAEKIPVGKRLAYWALAKTYGMDGLSYSGPIYKEMEVNKNKAILVFDYAENGLSSFGKELKGFVIAGDDKQFYPAKAVISENSLEVWSDDVKNPVAVRYCWENYAVGTLFNTAGLPASSFRSDHWEK
jgi:sialate O-acetylesterase